MSALALLEAIDRTGARVGSLAVTAWPVTVGRGLDADLVIDDPHLAPLHLRIDRPGAPAMSATPDAGDAEAMTPTSPATVEVLETLNGVTLRRQHFGAGDRFDWAEGQDLTVGRLRLSLRLADAALPPEQPLPRLGWSRVVLTLALLVLMLAAQLGRAWLESDESRRFLQQVPFIVAWLLGSTLLWAGLWALATRLFTGHQHFWRHVRIASGAFVAAQVVLAGSSVLGGMFSLEALPRFAWIGALVAGAAGLLAHLCVVAPQRRTLLTGLVSVLTVLGLAGLMTQNWLQTRRLSSELYMAVLLPPALRLAPAVPPAQFLDELRGLRERVDARLKDGDDPDAPAEADDEE